MYLQIHGTAISTCMAPSYANLFLGRLEHEFLETHNSIPQVWWRCTDDIFAIWTHGEPVLCGFVQNLNCHHPTIKITTSWSAEEAIFLDTRVYLKDSLIGTDLHVKPTNKHQFLCMDSCHPKHCKTIIPYSQVLRLWRIYLEDENFFKRICDLKDFFENADTMSSF